MAFIQECFVRNPENKFRLIVELERLGYRAMYIVAKTIKSIKDYLE